MSFPLSTFGVNPDDIRYLHCDSFVQGKGRDRLKYLDFEGRWILSGRSIPYISATFNHLEKLNYAKGGIFVIVTLFCTLLTWIFYRTLRNLLWMPLV